MATGCRASAAGITDRALDRGSRILLKGAGVQVGKVPVPEYVRIVALRAGNVFVDNVLPVLARVVAIVLARPRGMAGTRTQQVTPC